MSNTNFHYAVHFEKRFPYDTTKKYQFHSRNGFTCFGNFVKISSLGDPIFYANDQFILANYVNIDGEFIKIEVIQKVSIGPYENYYTPEEELYASKS